MTLVMGIDEAGRGCLAGPVCAACVAFATPFEAACELADSKKLSPSQREHAARILRERCVWGIGWAHPREIDELNIHHATLRAMSRAFDAACVSARDAVSAYRHCRALVDGAFVPPDIARATNGDTHHNARIDVQAIVKADAYIPEVQAASILAKTARDAFMRLLHTALPHYNFASHKGYPTSAHKHAIAEHGPCYAHRFSFAW